MVQAHGTVSANQHVIKLLNLTKEVASTICNVPFSQVPPPPPPPPPPSNPVVPPTSAGVACVSVLRH